MYSKICAYCGKEFKAEDSRTKYCSNSHKVMYHKKKKGLLSESQLLALDKTTAKQKNSGRTGPVRMTADSILTSYLQRFFTINYTSRRIIHIEEKPMPNLLRGHWTHYKECLLPQEEYDGTVRLKDEYYQDEYEIVTLEKDQTLGIKRVTKTPSGNFLISTTSRFAIEQFKKLFHGSDIFITLSKKLGENTASFNSDTPITYDLYQDIFNTIIPRERVIEVSKIPIHLL